MKETSLTEILRALPAETWHAETVSIQPIKLSTEWNNEKAQRLYQSVGMPFRSPAAMGGKGITMAIKYTPKAELSDFLLSTSFYHTDK